ncbi:hypothetical protein TrCOL_g8516 [Triparma columacea]|uniref:Uncharacterized protein n=1 Tax=Triparma columacea TaxID=722753 RepID=A0A9W7FZ12_9STRA|nr:hypothetical protein TrCOL_g8516 [Triparma columacea]
MGTVCAKENNGNRNGLRISTSAEVSIKRKITGALHSGGNGGEASNSNKENMAGGDDGEEKREPKKSKALRGAALIAACNFSSEEEDFDDARGESAKFSEISPPGLVNDESKSRKRLEKVLKKNKIDSPGRGGGTGRSKKFLADDVSQQGGKALRGKALLMACAGGEDGWSSDED